MKLVLASALALALAAPVAAAPPAGFDARVESLRRSLGVPGVAVAVVEDGKTTLAKGWGVTDLANPKPVDADTIFATGSTGKAFTVAALAILVDQGKLGWDEKVIDHMPEFRMYDPWVTREMTVRDLLVHRSGLGLGEGDLLFVPRSDLTRKETMRRVRYLKPATSFRSGYAYDNILYMVAGQLVEEVSGQSWEDFIRQHVFAPLGMINSTDDSKSLIATPNHAHPHARTDGPVRGLGKQAPLDETNAAISANAAPAGGLAISANDMSHWLVVQLAHGKLPGGGQLFSEAQSAQMWQPVVVEPIQPRPPELKDMQPKLSAYALGWDVQDYRGAKLIWHGGAVFGSLAAVALLPDRNVGIYVAANSEEPEIVRGLMYELLDHYLGLPRQNWPEKFHAYLQQRAAAASASVAQAETARARVGPSLPVARYAGDYADPWYGTINVREANGRLTIDFPHTPGMTATLEHWQYDTFKTVFADKSLEPAYVTFGIDADGKVDRVTMKAVNPAADFSWDYQDLNFAPAAR